MLSDYDLAVRALGECTIQKEIIHQQYDFRDKEAREYYQRNERLELENAGLRSRIERIQEVFRTTKEIPREFIDEVLKWK